MTEGIFFIPIVAGIDDLLGLLVVAVFVGISLIGNVIKAASEKKQQAPSEEEESELIPKVPPRRTPSPQRSTARAQQLPYAKSASPTQAPPFEQKNALQKLDELRQHRLEQIRAQKTSGSSDMRKQPIPKRPDQPRPMFPRPDQQARPSIPVAKPIPVAQSVKPYETASAGPRTSDKVPKATVAPAIVSTSRQQIITMLKDRKRIRNAIVAAEILGKPISLR